MKRDPAVFDYPFKNLLKLTTRYEWGGDDAELTDSLLEVRRRIARRWLNTPIEELAAAYAGRLGESHRLMYACGVRALPLGAEDAALLSEIQRCCPDGAMPLDAVRPLLAGMVLADAHEFPLLPAFEAIPEWFFKDYLEYAFRPPALFRRPGEADRYCEYMEELLTVVLAGARAHRATGRWRDAVYQIQKASFALVYFNEKNLSSLYRRRADLIEALLHLNRFPVNHLFPRRDPRRTKIKLGLLAAHFGPQTETYFTLAGLEHLDRERFEIALYAPVSKPHYLEKYIRTLCDAFVVLPEGDPGAMAARIRADDLDVLLVVSNVTAVMTPTSLLAAARLARVQAVQSACAATTGMRHVDYFLSARWNEPDTGAEAHYTERLFLMDEGFNYYAYRHDRDARSLTVDRNALGIADASVVFVSGANFFKIIPELAATWAKILAQVPDSVLVLYPFNPNWLKKYSEEAFRQRLRADFGAHGVDFKRVRIVPAQPARADVHELVKLADVYLDSHPFPGVCSLYDPLSLSCPVVAWRGTTMRSLHSTAMLRRVDAEDLVAEDEPDYIAKAVRLARDPTVRAAVRERLRARLANGNPFEDSRRFSAKIGAAVQEMFAAYRDRREAGVEKSVSELKAEAQCLADALRGNMYYEGLTDIELARSLIKPYFQWLDDLPEEPCTVAVGAGGRRWAMVFLEMGWRAELFETGPIPGAGQQTVVDGYLEMARVHRHAAGAAPAETIEPDRTGLPGQDGSACETSDRSIHARNLRLGDRLNEHGVRHVEFLEIDAGAWGFSALESHDFGSLPPRIVIIECSVGPAGRSHAELHQGMERMAARGYDAVVFEYDAEAIRAHDQPRYRLITTSVERQFEPSHERSLAGIVFYRQGDRVFLSTLTAMLESFCDTRHGI